MPVKSMWGFEMKLGNKTVSSITVTNVNTGVSVPSRNALC